MIPLIQDLVVDKKKWLTEKEAMDCIAISQSLPGVIAINMATYIGRIKKGLLGSIVATIGVITPSFFAIILIWEGLDKLGSNSYISGGFIGLKSAVVAMILWAAIRIGKRVLNNIFSWIIFIMALLGLIIFNFDVIFIILTAAVLGILYSRYGERGER